MTSNLIIKRTAKAAATLVVAVGMIPEGQAQEAVQKLEEVQVRADYDREVEGAFLPDVQGTKIHAGKKTSNIDLDELP